MYLPLVLDVAHLFFDLAPQAVVTHHALMAQQHLIKQNRRGKQTAGGLQASAPGGLSRFFAANAGLCQQHRYFVKGRAMILLVARFEGMRAFLHRHRFLFDILCHHTTFQLNRKFA
jgi:hypothetical protein